MSFQRGFDWMWRLLEVGNLEFERPILGGDFLEEVILSKTNLERLFHTWKAVGALFLRQLDCWFQGFPVALKK